MTSPTSLENPGLISLNNNGAVLTTHYRDDLFEDDGSGTPTLVLGSGDVTLSDGFSGTLANAVQEAIDNGLPAPMIDLGSGAQLDIVDDVANVLALAQVLEAQGLSTGDFFGSDNVGLTIETEDPTELQKLLAAPGLGLLSNVSAIVVPAGTTIDIPLSRFDTSISFSGVDKIRVTGSIEEFENFGGDLSSLDTDIYDFFVLDTNQNYQSADGSTDFDAAPFTQVDGYLLTDTVANLIGAPLGTGILATLEVTRHQANDDIGAIEAALIDSSGNSLDDMGIASILVSGDVTSLGGASADLIAEASAGGRLDGAKVTDLYSPLAASPFSTGILPAVTQIVVQDSADNISGLSPLSTSQNSINTIQLTGGTLPVTSEQIVESGVSRLEVSGGTFELTGSTSLIAAMAAGTSGIIDIFNSVVPNLVVKDSGTNLQDFVDADLETLPSAYQLALQGLNVVAGDLNLQALDLFSGSPFVHPIGPDAKVSITGDVDQVLDTDFSAGTLIIPQNDGQVEITVDDAASDISANALALGTTIQGFPAQYVHQVSATDTTLNSFEGVRDWFVFDSTAQASGNTFSIVGNFDIADDNSGPDGAPVDDVIDISASTGITDSDEENPNKDFAFVDILGGRTETIDESVVNVTINGLPPADILIADSESSIIQFDGFASAYDSVPDFSIYTPNSVRGSSYDGMVENGLTVSNFFGIPHQDQVLLDEIFEDTENFIPDVDLFRFDSLQGWGGAGQVGFILAEWFYGYNGGYYGEDYYGYYYDDERLDHVDSVINTDGDVLIGEGEAYGSGSGSGAGSEDDDYLQGDALSPSLDDVIFGLSGDDEIQAGDGDNFIMGGVGDDEIVSGSGDDWIEDKFGSNIINSGAGDDVIRTDDGADEIHAGPGDDTVWSKYDDDAIYGGAGDDSLYGGYGDDTIEGGAGNDYIDGDDGDDSIDGGAGLDVIYGSWGNDTITAEGARVLSGGYGNDDISFTGSNPDDADDLILQVQIIGGEGDDDILIQTGADVWAESLGIEIIGDSYSGGYGGVDTISILGDVRATVGDIDIEGNELGDTITIGVDANLTARTEIEIFGYDGDLATGSTPDGDDNISIAGNLTSEMDYIHIAGDEGADSIEILSGATLTSYDDIDITGQHGSDGNGDGNDTISIAGVLDSGDDIYIEGDDGDDTIRVTSPAPADPNQQAPVNAIGGVQIAGELGNDTIEITGAITAQNNSDSAEDDEILEILGGPGTDTISIGVDAVLKGVGYIDILGYDGDLAGSDPADGDDVIAIAGSLSSSEGGIHVAGDEGNDTIAILESATLTALDDIDITGQHSSDGNGDGHDTIAIQGSLSSHADIYVEGDDGDDIITIAASGSLRAEDDIELLGDYGNDIISVSGSLTAIDRNIGTGGVDTSDADNDDEDIRIEGGYGQDTITITSDAQLSASDDIKVYGGEGDDTISIDGSLSVGTDPFNYTDPDSEDDHEILIMGGDGADQISVESAISGLIIDGGIGNDSIFGDAAAEVIRGGDGSDGINAGDGIDTVEGGDGADFINGEGGEDLLSGGDGQDIFTYFSQTHFGDSILDFDYGSAGDLIVLNGGTLDTRSGDALLAGAFDLHVAHQHVNTRYNSYPLLTVTTFSEGTNIFQTAVTMIKSMAVEEAPHVPVIFGTSTGSGYTFGRYGPQQLFDITTLFSAEIPFLPYFTIKENAPAGKTPAQAFKSMLTGISIDARTFTYNVVSGLTELSIHSFSRLEANTVPTTRSYLAFAIIEGQLLMATVANAPSDINGAETQWNSVVMADEVIVNQIATLSNYTIEAAVPYIALSRFAETPVETIII